MTDVPLLEKKPSRWRKRRRMLGCGVFVVLLLVIGGWLGIRYVAGASFRGQAEGMIESAFGVEATLGSVRLHFFPTPRLAVYDVELSLDDAGLRVERLDLEAGLGALARGRLAPSAVVADGVTLSLPVAQGDAVGYLSAMGDALSLDTLQNRPVERSAPLPRIAVNGLHVVGSDGLWLAADLGGAAGKDDFFELSGKVTAPALGPDAKAQFAIAVHQEDKALSGVVEASGIAADQLAWVKAMAPGLLLEGRMVLGGTFIDGIQGELEGSSRSPLGSLDGRFEGVAWFLGHQVALNELHWQAPVGHTAAEATYVVGEGWRIVLKELTGNRDLIAALLSYFEGGAYAIVPGEDATLNGTEIAMVSPNEGSFAFVSGTFEGSDLACFEGDRVILENLSVAGSIKEGVFDIEELAHPKGHASGRVHIDYASSHVGVDWSGAIDLSTGIVGALWPELPPHEASGTALIEEAQFSWTPETGFAVEQLRCFGEGLEAMILPEGWDASAPLRNAVIRMAYAGEVLTFEQFDAEGVSVQGEIRFEEETFLLDLKGDIDLSSGLAAIFLPESVRSPQGRLHLAEARGRFHRVEGLGQDFRAEGLLDDVAAAWHVEGADLNVREVNGTFTTCEGGLTVQVAMVTDQAGPLKYEGLYEKDLMAGTLQVDPVRLASGLAPEALAPWLSALGGGEAERIEIMWRKDGEAQQVSARIMGGNRMSGDLLMAGANDVWEVENFSLQTLGAAQPLLSLVGLEVVGEGNVLIQISQNDAKTLRGNLDFRNASLKTGDFLEKRVGDDLSVEFTGAVLPDGFELRSLEALILDQIVSARSDAQGLKIPALDLDLARLARLFPADASVGGKITGAVDLGGGNAELMLDSLQLQRDGMVSISRLHGEVRYRAGHWLCENLEVKGEGNDFSLSMKSEGEVWQGAIRGASLDLEGLLILRDELSALWPQGAGTVSGGPSFVGRFDVALDSVRYHRGIVENVTGTAHLSPSSLRMDPFRCKAYEGTAQGALSWEYEGLAGVELALDKVDLRILDDLLFEDPRNVSGPLSGQVSVSFLPGSDAHPLATLNGTIQYEAEEGTYGRMGNATRLLSVLKTTELIRLSLPTLRDDGLTFQESSGDFVFENGLATVNGFMIRDQAYAMAGEGSVNFPEDTTDLQLHVHLLESVSGIVGSVPILRSTVQRFRETAGVRVVVSGSPFSPQFEADRAVKPLRALGTVLTAPFRGSKGDSEEE